MTLPGVRRAAVAASLALSAVGCTRAVTAPAPAGAPAATRQSLRAAIDSMVNAREFRNANWGILVVDPARGDTLYSHNAGKLFMPASNMKLVSGGTALAELGPDYRWRTTFVARGAVTDSVLRGDLAVIGRGDPTISDHMRGDAMEPLRALADSLRARGINRVAGRLVAAGDAFPDSVHGYGWSWSELDAPYSAGIDELTFNEGFTRVVLHAGGAPGQPVTAATLPSRSFPQLVILATTVAPPDSTAPAAEAEAAATRGRAGRPRNPARDVDVFTRDDSTLEVRGTMIAGDSAEVSVAVRNPDLAYLAALREALTSRGVRVDGGVVDHDDAAPVMAAGAGTTAMSSAATGGAGAAVADTVFRLMSPPLRDVLPALAKPSQNQIAEILLKTLALERTGVGSADSGRRVLERRLLAWGADSDGFAIRDGSGLSRHDYVTPETLVRLLAAVRGDTAFQVLYHALPVAGVDGTIARRMIGSAAAGNVHAKTGSVDKARSLSGYVTTADGHELVFSILSNNWTVPARDVEGVADAICERLALLRLTGR